MLTRASPLQAEFERDRQGLLYNLNQILCCSHWPRHPVSLVCHATGLTGRGCPTLWPLNGRARHSRSADPNVWCSCLAVTFFSGGESDPRSERKTPCPQQSIIWLEFLRGFKIGALSEVPSSEVRPWWPACLSRDSQTCQGPKPERREGLLPWSRSKCFLA